VKIPYQKFQFLLLLVVTLIFSACSSDSRRSSDENRVDEKYYIEADKNLDEYRLTRNEFYGYSLMQPVKLPANAVVEIDVDTGGNIYRIKDPAGVFTEVVLYVNNGLLSRLTLTKVSDIPARAQRFYRGLVENAEKTYPAKILINTGIGAHMSFVNDKTQWLDQYARYLEQKSRPKSMSWYDKPFTTGLHASLRSIFFEILTIKGRNLQVNADYITAFYLDNIKQADSKTRLKMKDI